MSIHRYFNERGPSPAHGGALSWLAGDAGPPLRNVSRQMFHQHEVDDLQETYDFKRRVFKLWEADDVEAYCDIRNRAANGWYVINHTSRHFVPEQGNEMVILEWLQVYREESNAAQYRHSAAYQRPGISVAQ